MFELHILYVKLRECYYRIDTLYYSFSESRAANYEET